MFCEPGAEIAFDRFIAPRVEVELAFVLAKLLRGPGVTLTDVLAANAINPMIVLFFLSFLPQFIVVSEGNVSWQIAALGVTFTALAAVSFSLLGLEVDCARTTPVST